MKSQDVFDVHFTDSRKTEEELDAMEQSLLDKGFVAILFTKIIGSEDRQSFMTAISRWDNHQGRFNEDYIEHQGIYYDDGYYDTYKVYHARDCRKLARAALSVSWGQNRVASTSRGNGRSACIAR
jgi:hypothetical protein